jgi:hypothetical protein
MMGADDESPEAWMAAEKRRNAIRMLVIGLVIVVAGGAWAVVYWNRGVGSSPITYVRVVSVLVIGIGLGLTVAGGVLIARRAEKG